MRIVLAAAASLILLAGCGARGGNEQNQAGLSVPPPRTGGDSKATEESLRRTYRELNIATCINSTRAEAQNTNIPASTDFRPVCTCYIDRAIAGLSVEQLARLRPGPREEAMFQQCARELGLGEGAAAAPAGNGSDGE